MVFGAFIIPSPMLEECSRMGTKEASLNIRHVSHEARVGVATVSRVINGSNDVSPKTRKHVEAVIRRLGYRPNAHARRIMRRAEMVCFMVSNRPLLHPFHAGILQGAEAYASDLKRHMMFMQNNCEKETPADQIVLPPVLEEKGWVNGVILTGAVYPNLISRIEALNLQLVVFGNNVFDMSDNGSFGRVCYDGIRAEFEATEYLINRGHRLIAFIGDTEYPWLREQYQGYIRAMRASKLNPLSVTRKRPGTIAEYAQWAAVHLLGSKRVPTAMLAGDDEIAYELYRSLRRLGVKIPGDISLIGFDDRELATLIDPPLTTVRVDSQEIGRCCIKLLFEGLHKASKGIRTQLVPTKLIERESVKWYVPPQTEMERPAIKLFTTEREYDAKQQA